MWKSVEIHVRYVALIYENSRPLPFLHYSNIMYRILRCESLSRARTSLEANKPATDLARFKSYVRHEEFWKSNFGRDWLICTSEDSARVSSPHSFSCSHPFFLVSSFSFPLIVKYALCQISSPFSYSNYNRERETSPHAYFWRWTANISSDVRTFPHVALTFFRSSVLISIISMIVFFISFSFPLFSSFYGVITWSVIHIPGPT